MITAVCETEFESPVPMKMARDNARAIYIFQFRIEVDLVHHPFYLAFSLPLRLIRRMVA